MDSSVLRISVSSRQYPIFIGMPLAETNFALLTAATQFLIVSHPLLREKYGQPLHQALQTGKKDIEIHWCDIAPGETSKNWANLDKVITCALERKLRRNCCFIALGGGVIGDLTGLAAGLYQRGASLIQIPTTLLAQVDSSIGGKTAINHPLGKNMIGLFYQPDAVIIDVNTLASLPEREFVSGLAEVIKYAVMADEAFFNWLDAHMEALLKRELGALIYAIRRSCEHKQAIVEADEREQSVRSLLNLGHTFGHALEALTHYSYWLHGEAIAIGMVWAAEVSALLGWMEGAQVKRIRALLIKAGLPASIDTQLGIGADDCLDAMALDKKNLTASLRTIMLKGIGRAVILEETEKTLIREAFTRLLR